MIKSKLWLPIKHIQNLINWAKNADWFYWSAGEFKQ